MTIPPRQVQRYLSLHALAHHEGTPAPEAESALRMLAHLRVKFPGIHEVAFPPAPPPPAEPFSPNESKASSVAAWAIAALNALGKGMDGALLAQAVQQIAERTVQISIVRHETGGMYIGIDVAAEAYAAADRLNARDVLHTAIAGMLLARLQRKR